MIPNAGFWATWFRENHVPLIEAFQTNAFEKVDSAFSGIEEEADARAEVEFERLESLPADPDSWTDMGDLAELATEHGMAYYETMAAVRQSVVNLLAVGLHHLFEQQQHLFFRRGLAVGETRRFTTCELDKRLRKCEVDSRRFECAAKVEELRVAANAIKHGAGNSADKLAEVRPDLLRDPVIGERQWAKVEADSRRTTPTSAPISPLAGADIHVSERDLAEWRNAVVSYWRELAATLDRQSRRPEDG